MNVKELIEELKKLPPNAEVRYGVKKKNGHLLEVVNKVEKWHSWVIMKGGEE